MILFVNEYVSTLLKSMKDMVNYKINYDFIIFITSNV